MTAWRIMADHAAVHAQMAEAFLKVGDLKAAADCLREAAAMLDQAKLQRDTEIGEQG